MTDFSEYNGGRIVYNEDPFPYYDPEAVRVRRTPEFPSPPGFEGPVPDDRPQPPTETGSLGDFSPANLAGCATPLDIVIKCGALQAFQERRQKQASAASAPVVGYDGGGDAPDARQGQPDAVAGVTAPDAAVVEAERAALLASLLPVIPPDAAEKIRAATGGKRKMKGKLVAVGQIPNPLPEKDNPAALFCNGYLRKGGGALVIAPSGVGKSVWTMQAAFSWALGKPAFGIIPIRELNIIIIQAEDDITEIADFRNKIKEGLIEDYHFDEADLDRILGVHNEATAKVRMLKMVGEIGESFVNELGALLDEHPEIDLVLVNPFHSFFGGDVSKNVELSHFLRVLLDKEIKDPGDEGKDRSAVMFVHHTNKPPSKDDDRVGWGVDMFAAYIGAGGAELVNWARAVLSLMPTKLPGLFRLCAGKRGNRLEWVDVNEEPTYTRMIKHAEKGSVYWKEAVGADMDKLQAREEEGKGGRGSKPGKNGAVGGTGNGGVTPKNSKVEKCSLYDAVAFASSHPDQSENTMATNGGKLCDVHPATFRRRLIDAASDKFGYLTVVKGEDFNRYAVTDKGLEFLNEPGRNF